MAKNAFNFKATVHIMMDDEDPSISLIEFINDHTVLAYPTELLDEETLFAAGLRRILITSRTGDEMFIWVNKRAVTSIAENDGFCEILIPSGVIRSQYPYETLVELLELTACTPFDAEELNLKMKELATRRAARREDTPPPSLIMSDFN